jgi:membrane-associated phospholipid phosphatase
LPVIGPRFYLYDFSQLSSDLPGLFFTEPIRNIINAGCNVPDPSNFTFAQVNPDCVPSGHTWIELIMLVMAFKGKSRLRWFYLIIGAGLIFSTLYLRYHYLFDLILGVAFFLITYYLEPKLAKLINNKR